MKKILIFGSCVSRDIFNFDAEKKYELVDYYARSSIVSVMGSRLLTDYNYEKISSDFQRNMVKRDIEKTFIDEIKLLDYDILLIDFIDERFKIKMNKNGFCCAVSSEFIMGGGFSADVDKELREIMPFSEEYFSYFETSWDIFVKILRKNNLLKKVRINKVFYSTKTEKGAGFSLSEHKIKEINVYLEKMYRFVEKDLRYWQILRTDKNNLVGGENHRWGLSPFHYVDAYYEEMLVALKSKNYSIWKNKYNDLRYLLKKLFRIG